MRFAILVLMLGLGGGCSALASMDDYSFDGHSDTNSGGDTEGSDSTNGSDSFTDDTSTVTGNDTETQTNAGSCPAQTHACVEDVVNGWNGPVALYLDDADAIPPACGGSFPETSLDKLTDLEVPNSTCGCSCGPSTGTTCVGTTILWYHGSSATCESTGSSFFYLTGACTPMGEVFGGRYWRLDLSGVSVSGGSCLPQPVVDVPAVDWGSVLLGCGGAEDAGGCGAGSSCLPKPSAPFSSNLCLYRQGDVQCPAGSAYSERAVYTTGVQDTRACTTCSCSTPTGTCAGTYATLESLAGCAPGSVQVAMLPGSGACVQAANVSTQSVSLHPVIQASCSVSLVELQGSAQATDPITVCCLAP